MIDTEVVPSFSPSLHPLEVWKHKMGATMVVSTFEQSEL